MSSENKKILQKLPLGIDFVKKTKSLAVLDAILMPDWEYRYYSYDSTWGADENLASMSDGQGEGYFALINHNNIIIKGYTPHHVTPLKIDDNLKERFPNFFNEPAFQIENTSFCIYSTDASNGWVQPVTNDCSLDILRHLAGDAIDYRNWANEYYEADICLKSVEPIFNFTPLTNQLVNNINVELSLSDIKNDLIEIDYPVNSST